jgi:pentapeptide MXKDX repeat protein
MRTIFHAAMFGTLISACSIGLVGCGSSNASQNKMRSGGDRMNGNMMAMEKMSGDKMSGEKMGAAKMAGDRMNDTMTKDQTP